MGENVNLENVEIKAVSDNSDDEGKYALLVEKEGKEVWLNANKSHQSNELFSEKENKDSPVDKGDIVNVEYNKKESNGRVFRNLETIEKVDENEVKENSSNENGSNDKVDRQTRIERQSSLKAAVELVKPTVNDVDDLEDAIEKCKEIGKIFEEHINREED